MKCIWCGEGKGIDYRNGFHYIHTKCVTDLMELADLGKAFVKEFVKKGSISKEFIESKIQDLINFNNDIRKKMEIVNDIIIKNEVKESG